MSLSLTFIIISNFYQWDNEVESEPWSDENVSAVCITFIYYIETGSWNHDHRSTLNSCISIVLSVCSTLWSAFHLSIEFSTGNLCFIPIQYYLCFNFCSNEQEYVLCFNCIWFAAFTSVPWNTERAMSYHVHDTVRSGINTYHLVVLDLLRSHHPCAFPVQKWMFPVRFLFHKW